MSETALKTKARRRLDSAIAGNTFVSRSDLVLRWGSTMPIVVKRVKKANIPEYVFEGGQCVRYKLADIEAYESQALARGFQKRAEQLKATS